MDRDGWGDFRKAMGMVMDETRRCCPNSSGLRSNLPLNCLPVSALVLRCCPLHFCDYSTLQHHFNMHIVSSILGDIFSMIETRTPCMIDDSEGDEMSGYGGGFHWTPPCRCGQRTATRSCLCVRLSGHWSSC